MLARLCVMLLYRTALTVRVCVWLLFLLTVLPAEVYCHNPYSHTDYNAPKDA